MNRREAIFSSVSAFFGRFLPWKRHVAAPSCSRTKCVPLCDVAKEKGIHIAAWWIKAIEEHNPEKEVEENGLNQLLQAVEDLQPTSDMRTHAFGKRFFSGPYRNDDGTVPDWRSSSKK